jgi:hypothetical protein
MDKVLLFAKACRLTDGEKAALTKDWLEMFKEANCWCIALDVCTSLLFGHFGG